MTSAPQQERITPSPSRDPVAYAQKQANGAKQGGPDTSPNGQDQASWSKTSSDQGSAALAEASSKRRPEASNESKLSPRPASTLGKQISAEVLAEGKEKLKHVTAPTEEELAKQRAELRNDGAAPMFNVEDLDSRFERVGIKGIRLKPEPKKKRVKGASHFKAAADAVISASSLNKDAAQSRDSQLQDAAAPGPSQLAGKPKFGLSPEDMAGSDDDSDLSSVGSSDDDDDEVLDEDWLATGTADDEQAGAGAGAGDGDREGSEQAEEAKPTEEDEEEEEDDGVDWSDLETLRAVLLRAQLTAENRREFVEALQRQTFQPGSYVVHQGEKGDSFYIITKGEVVVSKTLESQEDEESFSAVGLVIDGVDPSGSRTREGVLTRLYQGHFFGEMALRQKKPRNANVRVLSSQPV